MKNTVRRSLLPLLIVTGVLVWMSAGAVPASADPPAGVAVGPASTAVQPAVANVNLIQDGSFEAGVPNPFWEEYSTQFGTPLCGPGGCIGASYARTGSYWAWFGGAPGLEEHAAITQTVRIPTGPAQLHFFVWMEYSTGFITDTLQLAVDGDVLWSTNGADTRYTGDYREVTLDLAAYANGQAHAISFAAHTNDPAKGTSFMLDDVALYWQPSSQIFLPLLRKAP